MPIIITLVERSDEIRRGIVYFVSLPLILFPPFLISPTFICIPSFSNIPFILEQQWKVPAVLRTTSLNVFVTQVLITSESCLTVAAVLK